MGFRFRKSFKAGPVPINLSKSGIGYSVGTKGFRVTKKAGGGTRTTTGIPGTGVSYVKDSSSAKTKSPTKKASSAATSKPKKSKCNHNPTSSMSILPTIFSYSRQIRFYITWIYLRLFKRWIK